MLMTVHSTTVAHHGGTLSVVCSHRKRKTSYTHTGHKTGVRTWDFGFYDCCHTAAILRELHMLPDDTVGLQELYDAVAELVKALSGAMHSLQAGLDVGLGEA
jgi:hypothetical protein